MRNGTAAALATTVFTVVLFIFSSVEVLIVGLILSPWIKLPTDPLYFTLIVGCVSLFHLVMGVVAAMVLVPSERSRW